MAEEITAALPVTANKDRGTKNKSRNVRNTKHETLYSTTRKRKMENAGKKLRPRFSRTLDERCLWQADYFQLVTGQ